MADLSEVDLVGYERDLAIEVCRRLEIKPEVKLTGAASDGEEAPVRVVRQQWKGGTLILTCACEAWS